jgi:hypothetical protein
MRGLIEPPFAWAFNGQTRRRFARLGNFLQAHAGEVERWQAASKA